MRIALAGLLGLLVVLALGLWALGFRRVRSEAQPLALPQSGFVHDRFEAVLQQVVQGESVDYAALGRLTPELDRYVATLAVSGPRTDPQRFATGEARLAYYLNAYNALVLKGVAERLPLDSVQSVGGWIDPRPGFGFFYALRFTLDGSQVSLYELENELIRARFGDARVHAALNCASRSCPALSSTAFQPEQLEAQLAAAEGAFCASDRHVRVDDEAREVQLSAIFDWYRKDYTASGQDLLGYLQACAPAPKAAALARARAQNYSLRFMPYDWALNRLPP